MEGIAFSLNWQTHAKFSLVLRQQPFHMAPQKKRNELHSHYCFTLTTLLHPQSTRISVFTLPAGWWLKTSTSTLKSQNHLSSLMMTVVPFRVINYPVITATLAQMTATNGLLLTPNFSLVLCGLQLQPLNLAASWHCANFYRWLSRAGSIGQPWKDKAIETGIPFPW